MTTTTENHKEQSRDAYGFAISKENKQPKDWKEVLRKEEEERQIAWHEFLRRGLDGVTPPKKHRRKKEEEEEEEEEFDDVYHLYHHHQHHRVAWGHTASSSSRRDDREREREKSCEQQQ